MPKPYGAANIKPTTTHTITVINLKNFFHYYEGTAEHQTAVEMLEAAMPLSLLTDAAPWVKQYRAEPLTPIWPVTKPELAQIMGCSESSLPDSLMDDLARCVDTFNMDMLSMAYFLGQCGHESGGLRYPVEIHDGSNYEGRTDLGNTQPGDGVKFAGTGWIQVTGRYNHQSFSDYMASIGQADPKIMEIGKTYTSEKYPWTISGNWWRCAGMNAFCSNRPQHVNRQIDEVGARVNGRMPPNGAADRLEYTHRAFRVLGL